MHTNPTGVTKIAAMSLNWIGLITALSTFLGIWLGHSVVRKVEFLSPTVWLPSLLALSLGLTLEAAALMSKSVNLSAALGIVGITLLWDALEFWRQHRRVEKGLAPANPTNPRHARILATGGSVTTIDWFNREPQGHQLSPEDLQVIQENAA